MYKNILLAMHGEEVNFDQLIKQTLYLVERSQCKITLLNVIETNLIHYGEVDTLLTATAKQRFIDYINEIGREQSQKVLQAFTESASQKGIQFNWKTREGKPADEIIKELKENNYDLVVLGTKEPGPGNTSSRVKERLAKDHLCTVLMVK
ncbi:universal stress protein [Desulfofalx alkaliphila]|uniref:universal stress protein n=1 Tax=Desulfofalx alkaliphila TaxID=105483 RepID=UPI0004E18B94|nr:universal stress protein [Desulfofalx alkaliphila]